MSKIIGDVQFIPFGQLPGTSYLEMNLMTVGPFLICPIAIPVKIRMKAFLVLCPHPTCCVPFWKSSKDEGEKDRWSDLSPATFCSQFPMMTSWPSPYPALSCQISVCPIHQWCSIMRTHQSIKTFELVHCKLAGLLLKSIMTCGQYPNSNLVCNWILLLSTV